MLCSTTAMATQNNHIVMRFVVGSDLHANSDPRAPQSQQWEKDINNFINWSNNEHNSSLGLNYTFFNGNMFESKNDMKKLKDNYFSKLLEPYHYVIGNGEMNGEVIKIIDNDTDFKNVWNYSTDWLITDGNFTFVFLNISTTDGFYWTIANPAYLNSTLDTYADKKIFVFIHAPQADSPLSNHTSVINQTFIDIINSHPNVITVVNGHNHDVNKCYKNYTSIYNCWDGCLSSTGLINDNTFSGVRMFEVYDDGQVLTYEYSLTANRTVNMDIIYPLDTNKITSGQKNIFRA
jgi:hypothetical protein